MSTVIDICKKKGGGGPKTVFYEKCQQHLEARKATLCWSLLSF